jgi:hypothetical protein
MPLGREQARIKELEGEHAALRRANEIRRAPWNTTTRSAIRIVANRDDTSTVIRAALIGRKRLCPVRGEPHLPLARAGNVFIFTCETCDDRRIASVRQS